MSTLLRPRLWTPRRSGRGHVMAGKAFSDPSSIAGLVQAFAFNDTAKITVSGSDITAVTGSYGTSITLSGSVGTTAKSGVRTKNSLNVADFQGGTNVMSSSRNPNPAGGSRTVVMVCAWDVIAGGALAPFWSGDNSSDGALEFFIQDVAGTKNARCDNCNIAQVGTSQNTGTTAGTWFFTAFARTNGGAWSLWHGSSSTPFASGTDADTWSGTHSFRMGNRARGTTYYLDGAIAEFLDYDAYLSNTDIANLYAYENAKWAI